MRKDNYYYRPTVKVQLGDNPADYFGNLDLDYLTGSLRDRPLDFDLHLALYILAREKMPEELLAIIVRWVRDNKMLIVH